MLVYRSCIHTFIEKPTNIVSPAGLFISTSADTEITIEIDLTNQWSWEATVIVNEKNVRTEPILHLRSVDNLCQFWNAIRTDSFVIDFNPVL